jgi:hypothetical protein
LRATIITHGFAHGRDAAGERRFTDDLPQPEFVEQFVFGDHPVPLLEQIREDIEHFGFDANDGSLSA